MNLDKKMMQVNLKIICIILSQDQFNRCIYRVFTSDGGITEYVGYDRLPISLKEWLSDRNSFDYIISGGMFVSNSKVV